MADSPWNAKNPGRRINRTIKPQASQPENTPIPLPGFINAHPVTETPVTTGAQKQNAAPRSKRAGRKTMPPVNRMVILLFALLALALIAAAFSYSYENGRLEALKTQREEKARLVQAHKVEHLSARRRSGYLPLIQKYAKEYGISPSFVSAVIKCESSFRPKVESGVYARGLMQIMPDTGVWLAARLKIDDYQPDHLFEADLNIRFGAFYLSYLSDMFGGSPVMVAAAYHAGDGNVKNWALTRAADMKTITLEQIPTDDTRSYVRKVLDAYAIYYEEDIQAGQDAVSGALPPVPDLGSAGGDGQS